MSIPDVSCRLPAPLARRQVDAVDAPKFERGEMNTLDDEGVRSFLAAASATQWYPMVYLALFTGLRRSEVLALRWGDVDLDLARMYVNRAVHRLRTGEIVFRTTKSAKSRRMVALPPSAALMLREHREREQSRRELVDGATLDDQHLKPTTTTWRPPCAACAFRVAQVVERRS